MIPEKLPPAVAKSILRRIQQNGRKKENDCGEKPWCVFFSHETPSWLPGTSSEQWLKAESSPAHCAQPAEDPFPEPLQAFRDNEWEQEAKADGNGAFSLLNSPVVLLCSEKEMKGWKLPGGGELDCFLLHYNSLHLKLLSNAVFFPSPSHSNSHYFYERFLCNRLKKNRRKFLLVPCRAFCSFPFLLRPCNIGINSLLIEMVMSCWHFITVDVVTVIFNSSSEGGIASP